MKFEYVGTYVANYIGVAYYIAMAQQRLSHTAALILKGLSLGYRFGFDIMEVTGLPSGTVYPALRRLERDSFVQSQWEAEGEVNGSGRACAPLLRDYGDWTGRCTYGNRTVPLLARLIPEKRS